MSLVDDIAAFRDGFKKYQALFARLSDRHLDTDEAEQLIRDEEIPLRESLTEQLGALHPILAKLPGISTHYYELATRGVVSFFDEALATNPGIRKGESIEYAVQALNKAVGAARALGDKKLQFLKSGQATLFLAYAFRAEVEPLIAQLRQLSLAQDFQILEGATPRATSVSEKVKEMIDSSTATVAVMSKDTEKNGEWLASEWVVQEATYALGKKKTVIRLIEDGVKTDGRIFGDQEYIPVDLKNPAPALVKYATMLAALRER